MELFKNGIIPVKAGTAKFKVTSKANPNVFKIIDVKLEYKNPMVSATPEEEEVVLKVGETKSLNFTFDPVRPSEQRFDWTFDQPGIVDNEEVVESSGVTGALPTFLHKITGLQKGTVTATATPWDTTGGAKPVKLKIHVLGTMTIKPNRELNKDNNVEIEDGKLTYTKNVSDKATYYISNSILSRLLNVKVDGAVIDSSNYETEEGSIILNLKRNYLNTLAPGNHTLEVETRDGRVETAFTINAAPVTYKATHEYKSITPGMELPYDVTRFLPHTIYDLPDHRIVILGNRYREIEVTGGKWIFRGWNPESATVNGADLHFVGSWEFVANPVQPVVPPAAASSNKGAANGSAITNNKVVNTGDASGLVHMIMLLAFASTMMTVLVIRKRVK